MIKPNKRLSGYVTIEAAIVVPMILVTILSLIFVIRIFYIQATVQNALDEASNDFSYYAYLYEKTSILDLTNSVEDDWSESDNRLNDSYESLKAEIDNIIVNVNGLRNTSFVQVKKLNQYNASGKSLVQVVGDYIKMTNAAKTEIGNALESSYSVIESATGIFDTITSLEGRSFLETGGLALWSKVETFLGNSLIKELMKANISEEKMLDYVELGYDGMDFSKSNYFYNHKSIRGNQSVQNGNVIDVVVVYKVNMIELLPFFGEVVLMNRVTIDTWTGANK